MTAKDIAYILKSALDQEAALTNQEYGFNLQYNDGLAVAEITKFIEGKWFTFDAVFRLRSIDEPIRLTQEPVAG